jgi:hypothetical protein
MAETIAWAQLRQELEQRGCCVVPEACVLSDLSLELRRCFNTLDWHSRFRWRGMTKAGEGYILDPFRTEGTTDALAALVGNTAVMQALVSLNLTDVRIMKCWSFLQPPEAGETSWGRAWQPETQYDVVYLPTHSTNSVCHLEVVPDSHLDQARECGPSGREHQMLEVPDGAVAVLNSRTWRRLPPNRGSYPAGFLQVRYVPGFSGLIPAVQMEVGSDFPSPSGEWWWNTSYGRKIWPLVGETAAGRPAQRPAEPQSSGSAGWL